jgi:hypothetical protein
MPCHVRPTSIGSCGPTTGLAHDRALYEDPGARYRIGVFRLLRSRPSQQGRNELRRLPSAYCQARFDVNCNPRLLRNFEFFVGYRADTTPALKINSDVQNLQRREILVRILDPQSVIIWLLGVALPVTVFFFAARLGTVRRQRLADCPQRRPRRLADPLCIRRAPRGKVREESVCAAREGESLPPV